MEVDLKVACGSPPSRAATRDGILPNQVWDAVLDADVGRPNIIDDWQHVLGVTIDLGNDLSHSCRIALAGAL
jgi:hypothetical protein